MAKKKLYDVTLGEVYRICHKSKGRCSVCPLSMKFGDDEKYLCNANPPWWCDETKAKRLEVEIPEEELK